MKGYKPLGQSVVLKFAFLNERKSDGGIIIPLDAASCLADLAHEVMAVSEITKKETSIKPGDYVTLRDNCTYKDLRIHGQHYVQVETFHLLGVADEKAVPTMPKEVFDITVEEAKVKTIVKN